MGTENQIEIKIVGTEANESVRLRDFLSKVEIFQAVLLAYDKAINGGAIDYYKIGGLSYNSPPCVIQEAVPKKGRDLEVASVHETLISDIEAIAEGRDASAYAEYAILSRLYNLAGSKSGRVLSVDIAHGSRRTRIGEQFRDRIEACLGATTYSYGEVVGSLDVINLHGKEKSFTIYPEIGPKSVDCFFSSEEVKKQAITCIEKWVSVRGLLTYRERANFPVSVKADTIEIIQESSLSLVDLFNSEPIPDGYTLLMENRRAWDNPDALS